MSFVMEKDEHSLEKQAKKKRTNDQKSHTLFQTPVIDVIIVSC